MATRLLSHLAHVELHVTKLEESVRFFKEVLGLTESGREGDSVFLRCWGDYYVYSLILSRADRPALAHAAWRTHGPEELAEAVRRIEASGVQGTWIPKSPHHGPAYAFKGPGGHPIEIFWEVERYQAPEGLRSTYPERPQKATNHGIAPRQLDHLTVATQDVVSVANWFCGTLGFRFMATTSMEHDPNRIVFGVTTTNEKSHDLGIGIDFSPIPGRMHHLAFWVESHDELLTSADLLVENGVHIEFGPGRHGIGEQAYLYFREPSGIRVEINTGGYRNYVPDWKPVHWFPSEGSLSMYRNLDAPHAMMEAFPPAAQGAVPDADLEIDANPWANQSSGRGAPTHSRSH